MRNIDRLSLEKEKALQSYKRLKSRLMPNLIRMCRGVYNIAVRLAAYMVHLPTPLVRLAATVRNLCALLLAWQLGNQTENVFASCLMNQVITEIYFPHSQWLIKHLRNRLERSFDCTTFIVLCQICPGRYLMDIFQRHQNDIVASPNCLLMMIRRGLEPKCLAPAAEDALYFETYSFVIRKTAEIVGRDRQSRVLNYLPWASSPPSLVDGKNERELATIFRGLEAAAAPLIAPPRAWREAGKRLRVGIFRQDYKPCVEVHLLSCLVNALPPDIDFFFFGFADPPAAPLNELPFTRLPEADLPTAVGMARNMDLDAMLFSPPLWGYFGSPMMRLIAYRLARVQIYYLGDIRTSGIENLDYFLFPSFVNLSLFQPQFCETLLPIAWGIAAPKELFLSAPQRLKKPEHGRVVYVTLCHIGKISYTLIEAWGTILQRVKGSRLILAPYTSAAHRAQAPLLERTLNVYCERSGVARASFIINDASGSASVRKNVISQGDIYLDSFPYSGAISMAEALSAGLPSVGFIDDAYCSQLGAMVAHIVDLADEVMVEGVPAYIERAVVLGTDKPRRELLAKKIRDHVGRASLPTLNDQFAAAFWEGAKKVIRVEPG